MTSNRLVALDGLRGVAAIAVVLRHAHLPELPFLHGYLAVDLFFLLSGFVIAKSYEAQLASGRLGLAAYARVRLARLYPLLALGSTIGVAMFAIGLGDATLAGRFDWPRALASQFLLLPFLCAPAFFVFNSAHWSIVLELLANGAHALALPRLGNRALAGIVAASALGLLVAVHHFGCLDVGWTSASWWGGIPRVGFGFFGGVLLYRLRGRWLGILPQVTLAFIGAALLALANLPAEFAPWGWPFAIVDLAAVIVAFPLLVTLGSEADSGDFAPMLGTLSFPLYAIHKPLVEALLSAHAGVPLRVAAIIALVVLAWAIGRWIDEPLNAWFRARRKRQQPARLQARPA